MLVHAFGKDKKISDEISDDNGIIKYKRYFTENTQKNNFLDVTSLNSEVDETTQKDLILKNRVAF